MQHLWQVLISIAVALLVVWLVLIVLLWKAKPDDWSVRAAAQVLPDTLRLVRRLGSDRSLPFSVRLLLWLLIGYLLLPIDVIPDFVPVLGYADDVVAVVLVLRAVVRRSGPEALARHWPGTPAGLAVIGRMAGISVADQACSASRPRRDVIGRDEHHRA